MAICAHECGHKNVVGQLLDTSDRCEHIYLFIANLMCTSNWRRGKRDLSFKRKQLLFMQIECCVYIYQALSDSMESIAQLFYV